MVVAAIIGVQGFADSGKRAEVSPRISLAWVKLVSWSDLVRVFSRSPLSFLTSKLGVCTLLTYEVFYDVIMDSRSQAPSSKSLIAILWD